MNKLFSNAFLSLIAISSAAQTVTGNTIIRGSIQPSAQNGELAAQSDLFVDSIGFATHISYDNSNYADHQGGSTFEVMIAQMQDMGLRHVRDGFSSAWSPSNYEINNYKTLGQAGIDLTLISDVNATAQSIESFASWVGNLVALEGLNECDQQTPNCQTAATSQLSVLQSAAYQLGIYVIGPSSADSRKVSAFGNIAPLISYNNIHCYYGGRPPDAFGGGWGGLNIPAIYGGEGYQTTVWWAYQNNQDALNIPSIVTETGYLAPSVPTAYQISASVQASYLPRTLLNNFAAGIKRTFLYEFLDEAQAGSGEDSYGVIDQNMNPKPAYTAIKNLISLTSDKGPSFAAGRLAYTLSNHDASLRHLLLQKRDGHFLLAMWLEQSSWDPALATPLSVSPQNVTLSVPGHALQTIYKFSSTGESTTSNLTGSSSTIQITDQVAIVSIL